jgi:hypothetical protein
MDVTILRVIRGFSPHLRARPSGEAGGPELGVRLQAERRLSKGLVVFLCRFCPGLSRLFYTDRSSFPVELTLQLFLSLLFLRDLALAFKE